MRGWLLLATWWGVGKCPVAPGTIGSMAALPVAMVLMQLPLWGYGATVGGLFFLGGLAAKRAESLLGRRDHPSIVIDEVVGTLLALMGLKGFLPMALVFFLFRAFDTAKPFPIRRLEGIGGGMGIMLDDLLAGAYARCAMAILFALRGSA